MGSGAGATGTGAMGSSGAVLNASPGVGSALGSGAGATGGMGIMNASAGAQRAGMNAGGLSGFGQKVKGGLQNYGQHVSQMAKADLTGDYSGLSGKQMFLASMSKGLKDAGAIMAGINPGSSNGGSDLIDMLKYQKMQELSGGQGIAASAGTAPVATKNDFAPSTPEELEYAKSLRAGGK